MSGDVEKILFTERQIKKRVGEIARTVDGLYKDKTPLCVGILKGGIIFYSDLVRRLTVPAELDFMAVSSYGSGAVSSGKLKIKKDLDKSVAGRDVIIIDDIMDSGFTLANLKALLAERGAKSVVIVTLLNKKARRTYNISPDYSCFDVGDEFVIGYGMDYDERYRSLPYIGVLNPSVYARGVEGNIV